MVTARRRPQHAGHRSVSRERARSATNLRIRLAATRGFLTVVPASILKLPAKHDSLRKLSVEFPTTHRQIGIVTLKNRTLSPLAQRFIETAREVAKPLAGVKR